MRIQEPEHVFSQIINALRPFQSRTAYQRRQISIDERRRVFRLAEKKIVRASSLGIPELANLDVDFQLVKLPLHDFSGIDENIGKHFE